MINRRANNASDAIDDHSHSDFKVLLNLNLSTKNRKRTEGKVNIRILMNAPEDP
jgi:hypothetical protein